MIGFANLKYLLYISLITVIVLALYIVYLFWKKRIISALIGSGGVWESLIRGSRRAAAIKAALIIFSIILFGFVVLRPQFGEKAREVNYEGSDVLIALDVSNSMLAQDVKPSRLQRAKDAVRWIAESLKGDRIGLILFAGDAFLQCPLTNDIGAFMMFLDSAGPESIRLQGTDIGRVLRESYRVFTKKRLTSRILVLITDGEDHEGSAAEAVARFRELDVSVYTIGVGRDDGEFIPVGDSDSSEDIYYRDTNGNLIRTRKNPGLLKKIAALTGGGYIDITDNFFGLKFILEIISDQQKNKYGSKIIKERKEQFEIFAVVLLLLLSVELMLPERKREPHGSGRRIPGILLLILRGLAAAGGVVKNLYKGVKGAIKGKNK